MHRFYVVSLLVALSALSIASSPVPADASFHFMQIEQAIGGVDGDTNAQAVQLQMRNALQNQFVAACEARAPGPADAAHETILAGVGLLPARLAIHTDRGLTDMQLCFCGDAAGCRDRECVLEQVRFHARQRPDAYVYVGDRCRSAAIGERCYVVEQRLADGKFMHFGFGPIR